MSVDEFTGDELPAGWAAVQPDGTHVTMAGDYLQMGVDPGMTVNSLSNSVSTPQGPYVWREVTGAFDFAVALAEEAHNLPNQGLDLLALGEGAGGVRFGAYRPGTLSTFRNDIGWFVWSTGVGTVLNTTGDDPMGDLYGSPGWLRMAWDGVDTYTCWASHTGMPGSWHQIAQFTSVFAPTRFAVHANAVNSGTTGRVQRVQRVVDLAARGDDPTTPPGDVTRVSLYATDFSSGTLPDWLTPVADNNGQVAVSTDGVELSIDRSMFRSHAWLVGPDDLPVDHGLLVRYQLTAAGYTNSFWVPAINIATTTDIAGAKPPDDKWGPGTSILMEMPGRAAAGEGDLVRFLRRSPVEESETMTGNREFDGYTLMVEDPAAPVSTVGTPVCWLRMERAGHRVRVRLWQDGDPEPDQWHYEAEDHMRHGRQAAISLAHNDGVSGTGTAAVRLSHVELYEVSEDPLPSGPFARYRAADLAGALGDGDQVAEWADATGNGHTLTQATSDLQPIFRATTPHFPAPHPSVDFLNVGTRRIMSAVLDTPLPVTTWAAMLMFEQVFTSTRVFLDGDGSERHAVFYTGTQSRYAIYAGTVLTSSTTSATAATPHTIVAVFDGADSGLWVDGVLAVSGNPGSQELGRIVLGAEADGDAPADVHLLEVLLWDRALDAGERQQVLDYFHTTYLGLPVTSVTGAGRSGAAGAALPVGVRAGAGAARGAGTGRGVPLPARAGAGTVWGAGTGAAAAEPAADTVHTPGILSATTTRPTLVAFTTRGE